MHEDTLVDARITGSTLQDLAVPRPGREVHLEYDWSQKGAEKLADYRLDDGQGGVAMGLARHDDVARHGRRRAAHEQEADEEPWVHEAGIGGAQTDNGKGGSGADEVALELDEDVQLPTHVVGEHDAGVKGTAIDEEDDGDGQVGDYCALDPLL